MKNKGASLYKKNSEYQVNFHLYIFVDSNKRFTDGGQLTDNTTQSQKVSCVLRLHPSTETFATPGNCNCFSDADCDACEAGYMPNSDRSGCEGKGLIQTIMKY